MRVLMTCIPGHGHFLPLVPLGRALASGGHDVAVATSASFCPTVEATGLRAVAAGCDWLESEPQRRFPELAGLAPHVRSAALGQVISYLHPKAMVGDLRALTDRWRPDVVVVEPSEWGGVCAAELEDVPYALVAIALCTGTGAVGGAVFPALRPADPVERETRAELFFGRRSLAALRRELGLPPPPHPWEDQPLNRRYLTFDTAPPSLHFYTPEAAARTAHPLRPVSTALAPAAPRARHLERPSPRRRLVHVTLGTVLTDARLLTTLVHAMSEEGFSVVVSTGPSLSPQELGPLPDTVEVERWVDYGVLLPRCELVVSHGGSGMMLAALAHGVPLLVVPLGADQPINAARIQSVGAGRFLTLEQVTPEALRREARVLIDDPVYRLNARRMAAEIAAMPGPEEAVGVLERLAAERSPLTRAAPLLPAVPAAEVPVLADPTIGVP